MAGDYGHGRGADPGSLAPALSSASAAFLDGALANPALQPHHILQILRNRAVTPGLIRRISLSPVWMKSYRVRASIVLHPATPRPVALAHVSSLRWGDLARVAASRRLSSGLRVAAERILLLRLPELAVGERVSLARCATPPVIRGLRRDPSALVIRSLLDNPMLHSDDTLFLAERPETSGAVLTALAESTRFSGRLELRLALANHPDTPPAVALRIVTRLDANALVSLVGSDRTPILVRLSAERRLSSGPLPTPPSGC